MKHFNPSEVATIVAAQGTGSAEEVGRRLDVCGISVRRYWDRSGVHRLTKLDVANRRKRVGVAMLAGVPVGEIAEGEGITPKAVRELQNRMRAAGELPGKMAQAPSAALTPPRTFSSPPTAGYRSDYAEAIKALRLTDCRWTASDLPFQFCCKPNLCQIGGRLDLSRPQYCAEHARLAYLPSSRLDRMIAEAA